MRRLIILIAFLGLWSWYGRLVDSRFYLFEGGSAHYLVMAKYLAEHHRYWEYHLPEPEPHIKIPPLLSLMLAVIYAFAGIDILYFKIFFFLSLICASLAGYLLFLKLTKDWRKALMIIVLSLLMPLNFSLMQKIASEIPYLAFSYLALYFLLKASEKKFSFTQSLLVGVWLGLSCLLRTAGLALILAFLIFSLIELRRQGSRERWVQTMMILLISSVFFIGWALRNHLVKTEHQLGYFNFLLMNSEPGSLEQGMNDLQPPLWPGTSQIGLENLFARVLQNTQFYLYSLSKQITLHPNIVSGSIFALLGLLGFFTGLKKYLLANIYGILSLSQIILWPFTDQRFLSPITGFFIFWILNLVSWLVQKRKGKKFFRLLVYSLSGFLIFFLALSFIRMDTQILKSHKRSHRWKPYPVSHHFVLVPLTKQREAFAQLLLWTRAHTEKEALIATIDPYLVALVSERKATLFPATEHNQEFWNYLMEKRVNYLMVDEIYQDLKGGVSLMTPAYLLPALKSCPFNLKLVYQVPFSRTQLLAINYDAQF